MSADANAQRVLTACAAHWQAHRGDCNLFVKAVSDELGVAIPPDANADAIVDFIAGDPSWTELSPGDGGAAKAAADSGQLVIGGLKHDEFNPRRNHGHVVVVVSGMLDESHNKYPHAYWGSIGGYARANETVNHSFDPAHRDSVRYFSRSFG